MEAIEDYYKSRWDFGEWYNFFAVEPIRHLKQNLPGTYPAIKLVKYEHKEPKIKLRLI